MRRAVFAVLVAMLLLSAFSGSVFAQKVSIRYWTFLDPNSSSDPRSEAQRQIIAGFHQANPGIEVKMEFVPWGKLTPNLIQAAEAGNTPDVARSAITYLEMVTAAGAISPLDEFIGRWPKEGREDWLLPASYTTVKNRRMGLFIEHRARGLIVRKDLIDKAGMGIPKSLDELAKVASAISKTGVDGFVVGMAKKEDGAMFGEWFLVSMLGEGSTLVDSKGKATFNDKNGVKIMQWLYDLVYTHKAMPQSAVSMGAEDSLMGMKAGRIAIMPEGSHRMAAARSAEGMADKIIFMPSLSFDPTHYAPAITSGYTLVMGKDSKHKEEAWKLIEWVTGRESMVTNGKIGGELPARKSSYQDPFFKSGKGQEMLEWRQYIEKNGVVTNYPENWSLMMSVVCDAAQEVLVNKVSPKQALDVAAKRYNDGR